MAELKSTPDRRLPTAILILVGLAVLTTGATAAVRGLSTSETSAVVSPPKGLVSPLELRAFSRAQTAQERAARNEPDILEAVEALTSPAPGVPEEWQPGAARNDLRILLAGLGPSSRSIFAFTSTKGRVCFGLTGFTSGCSAGMPAFERVTVTTGDPDAGGTGEPALVWGFARDGVSRVEVVVAGERFGARLANNAYFFQLPNGALPTSAIEAIVVSVGDRSTTMPVVVPRPGGMPLAVPWA